MTTALLITPDDLIRRFCQEPDRENGHSRITKDASGGTTARGFCGYMGGRGPSMVTGYDDGYYWMEDLTSHGWKALPNKGDWPYLVYLTWQPKSDDDRWAIAEYCEADLTVWVFPSREAAQAHYGELRDIPE